MSVRPSGTPPDPLTNGLQTATSGKEAGGPRTASNGVYVSMVFCVSFTGMVGVVVGLSSSLSRQVTVDPGPGPGAVRALRK